MCFLWHKYQSRLTGGQSVFILGVKVQRNPSLVLNLILFSKQNCCQCLAPKQRVCFRCLARRKQMQIRPECLNPDNLDHFNVCPSDLNKLGRLGRFQTERGEHRLQTLPLPSSIHCVHVCTELLARRCGATSSLHAARKQNQVPFGCTGTSKRWNSV